MYGDGVVIEGGMTQTTDAADAADTADAPDASSAEEVLVVVPSSADLLLRFPSDAQEILRAASDVGPLSKERSRSESVLGWPSWGRAGARQRSEGLGAGGVWRGLFCPRWRSR